MHSHGAARNAHLLFSWLMHFAMPRSANSRRMPPPPVYSSSTSRLPGVGSCIIRPAPEGKGRPSAAAISGVHVSVVGQLQDDTAVNNGPMGQQAGQGTAIGISRGQGTSMLHMRSPLQPIGGVDLAQLSQQLGHLACSGGKRAAEGEDQRRAERRQGCAQRVPESRRAANHNSR